MIEFETSNKLSWRGFSQRIKANPQRIPLPFALLIEKLQNNGFVVGVDQYLRLHALLKSLNIDANRPPHDLKTLLCPIFAVNADQQKTFYRIFDQHFPFYETKPQVLEEKKRKTTSAKKIQKTPEAGKPISRWHIILAAGLWIVMIALVAQNYMGKPQVERPKSQTKVVDPIVKSDPQKPRKKDIVVEVPIVSTTQPMLTFYQQYGHAIRWTAGLTPLVLLALFLMVRALNQQIAAARGRGGKPPYRWPLKVEPLRPPFFGGRRFFKIAARLNQRILSPIQWLDIDATITATIKRSGFPCLKHRPATQPPEYLVLIDKAQASDLMAALAVSLCQALGGEGLFIKSFGFTADPRICFDLADGRRFNLASLVKRCPNHRLMVMGAGDAFIDPDTGGLADWTAIFDNWPGRALLTPVAANQWGMREVVLARLFTVLPVNLDGLAALGDHLEKEPQESDLKMWVKADQTPKFPPRGRIEKMDALKAYLGNNGFNWLCACAVYPELNWGLTLRLGKLTGALGENNLLRLVRLPWFREGQLPEEMRLKLLAALDAERLRLVTRHIGEALAADPPARDSAAWDFYRLNLAVHRAQVARKWRKRLHYWQEARQAAGQLGQDRVLRDPVLVKVLNSARLTPQVFKLPQKLRKHFFRSGLPLLGVRTTLVALLLILASILAFWWTPQPATVQIKAEGVFTARFVNIPAGDFMMGQTEEEKNLLLKDVGNDNYEKYYKDELPRHNVILTQEFYMQTTEITVGQWNQFANSTGYRTEAEKGDGAYVWTENEWKQQKDANWQNPYFEQTDDSPVTCVSWNDVQAFIQWLNSLDQNQRKYALPTEAQWEYACRAGAQTPFAFGRCLTTDQVNYNGNYPMADCPKGKGQYREKTIAVGSLEANQWGLYDMHGNVWEWCQDWYGDYPSEAVTDPRGPESGALRVSRGGGWDDDAGDCRSANRGGPGYRNGSLGFRLVLRPVQ